MAHTKTIEVKEFSRAHQAFAGSLARHCKSTGEGKGAVLSKLQGALNGPDFDFEKAGLTFELVTDFRRQHAASDRLVSSLNVSVDAMQSYFVRGSLLRRLVVEPTKRVAQTGEFRVVAVCSRSEQPGYLDFVPPGNQAVAKEYAVSRKTTRDPVPTEARTDAILLGVSPESRALRRSVTSPESQLHLLVPVRDLIGSLVKICRVGTSE